MINQDDVVDYDGNDYENGDNDDYEDDNNDDCEDGDDGDDDDYENGDDDDHHHMDEGRMDISQAWVRWSQYGECGDGHPQWKAHLRLCSFLNPFFFLRN